MQEHPIRWFITAPQACPYLDDREMQSLLVDPAVSLGGARFGQLLAEGFRRSGQFVYRHHCPECAACVPVRIPVARFRPNRSQRRCLDRNQDLAVAIRRPPEQPGTGPAADLDEHMPLFSRYQTARHAGGGMEQMGHEEYAGMLAHHNGPVDLIEFRQAGTLVAVAVTDRTPQGLSAMYSFFDPDQPRRGLGTLAILTQVAHAHRLGLPHVYLGYWIDQAPKMEYKTRFQPLEGRMDGVWRRLPA
ncbi:MULTISPECIES: arginyltransferase [unclassified Thioalkalivibrio]|uniref:arginyltransferase n=1 Tax=unclassified Thioalkalivibrio TaxID=2621013 RepID=UPI00037BE4A6|nr:MULTISPECIES: arginyltransferase [unclassified Thioalkalivibrio]